MQAAAQSQGVLGLTHSERGSMQLRELCRASGLVNKEEQIVQTFRSLVAPWGDRRVDAAPEWKSDVCDDHTPYEFSLALDDVKPELRILVEAQGDRPELSSHWAAGRKLSEQLAAQFNISLERLRSVEDLFTPGPRATLAIWHAVCFWPDRDPEFKVYFDAQARGRAEAPALLEEALCRLGFARSWGKVSSAALRGTELDEHKYLSLDLAPGKESRVKVYVRYHNATLKSIEAVLGDQGAIPKGEAAEFCRMITGSEGPFTAKPIFVCTTLTESRLADAPRRTLYIPIAAYAENDEVARGRIQSYLAKHQLPAKTYEGSVKAFSSRSLESGVGLHSYVSLRMDKASRRVTVYFSPEAYTVKPSIALESGSHPVVNFNPPPAEEIVRRYQEDIVLAKHPFFQRLGREPVNLSILWLVMANFWEAIVHDFPSRLSRVVAKVEDDRVRSVVVKQLNDELGEGDFSKAHKAMFRRLVSALEPHRMNGDDAKLMAPGREFGARLGEHLFCSDDYETIGALMMIEIYGSQTDTRLGDEFRRQQALDPKALEWLHLHEDLEVDHAGDSLTLARLIPNNAAALEGTWRGASGVVTASHKYFDGLYDICFS
jgi:DMATS type aromatic prenyltransferase